MCDQKTLEIIEGVVDSKVDQMVMFTAFEVSLDVKKKQKDAGLPVLHHSEMKSAIHKAMMVFVTNNVYSRLIVDVGAPSKAILYFPPGANPTDYVPLPRDDKTEEEVSSEVPTAKLLWKTDTKKLDQCGRLRVVSVLTRAATFKPRTVVHVLRTPDGVKISRVQDNTSVASYVVDVYGGIRITNTVLKKAFGFAKSDSLPINEFKLKAEPGSIKIQANSDVSEPGHIKIDKVSEIKADTANTDWEMGKDDDWLW